MSRASIMVDRVAVVSRGLSRWVVGVPDVAVAAGPLLGVLALVEVVVRGEETAVDAAGALLLALGATVPLAFAQSSPLGAAATIMAVTVLTLTSGHRLTGAALVAELVAVHLVAARRTWRVTVLLVLPFLVYALLPPSGEARRVPLLLLALVALAAGLGMARRLRREAAARTASTRSIADTLLEHAARGERARMARELHDVVAHHISMISVQAEIARLTTPGMPPEGARRLAAIGDTARTALTEMQRLLGVLREDAATEPTRAPQPGLHQLVDLIDEARDAADASTRLIVRGQVVSLDAGVELSAYRIVQEALTNARRHAPGAAVDVELVYAGAELRLRVRDNGPGPPAGDGGAGHGLLGMRERAAMVGGVLSTGRTPAGGFQVEAVLPIPEPAA